MAAVHGDVTIRPMDELQCEFNMKYIPCEALSSFNSNDVRKNEESLVKIRICESAYARRFRIANIECLIQLHRINLDALSTNLELRLLSMRDRNCDTSASKKNDIVASCSYLTRFISAMRTHERITTSKGRDEGNALFTDQCAEHYPMFLDDYIHFMRKHSDDAETIKAEAHKKFGLTNCSISKCKVQRRHSRRRGREGGGDGKSDGEHFYGDVMASAHFVLQHGAHGRA